MQKLLTPNQAAEVLNLPVRTLADWRHRGLGPPWLRVGRHARYPDDGLTAWIDEGVTKAAIGGDAA